MPRLHLPTTVTRGGFLGIDPGASGAISIIDIAGVASHKLAQATPRDTWDYLATLASAHEGRLRACIEDIPPAIFGAGKSSCAKLYGSFKQLEAFLIAIDIPFKRVKAKVWQKALAIPPRKKTETTTQWKNRLKEFAQRLFPKEQITLATSDSLLIAHFCTLPYVEES